MNAPPGTALGDPIEVGALKSVYGQVRESSSPLVIGAVKTNIGHLEGASGMAGLIKTVLVLQHSAAPSNLHLTTLNPKLDLEHFPVLFPAALTPLDSAALAAVSSFGFGGANAHAVLARGDDASSEQPAHVSRAEQSAGEGTRRSYTVQASNVCLVFGSLPDDSCSGGLSYRSMCAKPALGVNTRTYVF